MEHNFFTFDIVSMALSITISLIVGVIVFLRDRSSITSKMFLLFIIANTGWGIFNYLSYQNISFISNLMLVRLVLFFAILQVLFFFLLMYVFPKKDQSFSRIIKRAAIPFASFVALLTLTPFVYKSVSNLDTLIYQPAPGVLFPVFGVTALLFVLLGIRQIVIKINNSAGNNKKQMVYLTRGVIFMFLLIIIFNFILPTFFSITDFVPLSSFFILPFLFYTSYSILKFQLFNIKVIATELITFTLWIFILIRTLLANTFEDRIVNSILFIIVVVVGLLLIKSVRKEVEQRERLEILRLKLEESNTNLEKANEKLKSLDKLKTEFVSLASHQLRSPLTAIKGYASMLSEGDYGDVSNEAKDAIDRIYQSTKNLTTVVEDLLNVTKIESGGMQYTMAPFDLSKVVEDEAKDLSITAEKRGLKLNFEFDEKGSYNVNGDKEKIRQVIINFIDNSIKYTKEGSINVSVKNNDNKVLFCVKDTGMGMTEEIKEGLFHKFARGDGARMNTTGSGLGLYLAKEIVLAHKGRVWVESEGTGKGSSFYMELDQAK